MKQLILTSLLSLFTAAVLISQVTDYQRNLATTQPPGQKETLIVLRKWKQSGVEKLLVVHPSNLKTEVLQAGGLKLEPGTWQNILERVKGTPYLKAMANAYEADSVLHNVAFTATNRYRKGIDLTLDLCSSNEPLNRKFFDQIVDLMNPDEKPVPLTVAVTGIWMIAHPDDLMWLKRQQISGILNITWVNHGFHHHYDPGRGLPENFMQQAGANIDKEILMTEKLMLANGITPSIYFRFPGSVTNEKVFQSLADYGLIGLGSDTWLSKGLHPDDGRTVLVHANGNSPLSEQLYLETMRNNREVILRKQWLLYNLP